MRSACAVFFSLALSTLGILPFALLHCSGGCDLVLTSVPQFANGLGLRIHIRTKINTWWSFIESAVLQLGSDLLEVKGGPTGGQYWINGVAGSEGDSNKMPFSAYHLTTHRVSNGQMKYRIDFGNGKDAIALETFKDWVRVSVRAQTDQFHGAVGLMGSHPTGEKLARNGTTVFADDDTDAFGLEWQVQPEEDMLFREIRGVQAPQQCEMPSMSASAKRNLRRRLGEALITEEDAQIACAKVTADERDACVFDVLATNDKATASSY